MFVFLVDEERIERLERRVERLMETVVQLQAAMAGQLPPKLAIEELISDRIKAVEGLPRPAAMAKAKEQFDR